MILGYRRISDQDQNSDLQLEALKNAGCEEIYSEKNSGKQIVKPEFEKLYSKLRKGDVLVVNSLDRLGRTSKQLINLLYDLMELGVQFKSLRESQFDTSTAKGEAIYQIMTMLKAMEAEVLRERTMDGLKAARARGRKGGRPSGSYNKTKAAAAATLYKKEMPISEITTSLKISRSTLYSYLRKEGIKK